MYRKTKRSRRFISKCVYSVDGSVESINQGSEVLTQMLTSLCQADTSGGSVQKPHAEFVF